MPRTTTDTATAAIARRVLRVRGLRVLLDSDLAELYGVQAKVLNQAVLRNTSRFPPDFSKVTICDLRERSRSAPEIPADGVHRARRDHGCDDLEQ
jgi:hypothetical protein